LVCFTCHYMELGTMIKILSLTEHHMDWISFDKD
jgi:hypothetical protein